MAPKRKFLSKSRGMRYHLLIPSVMRRGDKIGVVSPSAPITGDFKHRFERGLETLRRLGFEPVLAKNALKMDDYSAGTPRERADDINSMFANRDIAAVICSQGGDTANSCLPFLDWECIGKNPKIFLGLSDISVLINAIHARTGLVTFHGNGVVGFSRLSSYDRNEFLRRLVEGRTGTVNANGPRRTVREGIAEGKLLGGNLWGLLKLAGTSYWPDFTDSILFVEAYKITPSNCDYMFNQLKQTEVFDKVRGVIVGHVHSLETRKTKVAQMEDVLRKVTAEYSFPILKTEDFGHMCSNTVLPVGIRARLDASKKKVEIIDSCVEQS